MNLFSSQQVSMSCPQCASPINKQVWFIIDIDDSLTDINIALNSDLIECDICQEVVGKLATSKVVFRRGRYFPIIFSPPNETSVDVDKSQYDNLLANLQQILADEWMSDWLANVLVVPRFLLLGCVSNDILEDDFIVSVSNSLKEALYTEDKSKYQEAKTVFVKMEQMTAFPQILSMLDSTTTWEKFREILETYPFLADPDFDDALSVYLEGHLHENTKAVVEHTVTLIRKSRLTGIPAALYGLSGPRHHVISIPREFEKVVQDAIILRNELGGSVDEELIRRIIQLWQSVLLNASIDDYPDFKLAALVELGRSYFFGYEILGQISYYFQAINMFDQVAITAEGETAAFTETLLSRSHLQLCYFSQTSDLDKLDKAVEDINILVDGLFISDLQKNQIYQRLIAYCQKQVKGLKSVDALQHIYHTLTIQLRSPRNDATTYMTLQDLRADCLVGQFHINGLLPLLDEAINIYYESISLTPEDKIVHGVRLSQVAVLLLLKYQHTNESSILDEIIRISLQAIRGSTQDLNNTVNVINTYSLASLYRFQQIGNALDIEQAVDCIEGFLREASDDLDGVCVIHNNYGLLLRNRYETYGDAEDIDRAIAEHAKACYSATIRPHYTSTLFGNYGIALHERFKSFGRLSDLDKAIDCFDVASRTSQQVGDVSNWQNSLALVLQDRFEAVGALDDIERAVKILEMVIDGVTPETSDWARKQYNLGIALFNRAQHLGHSDDLERAINLLETALKFTSPGTRDWDYRSSTYSSALTSRTGLGPSLSQRKVIDAIIASLEAVIQMTPKDSLLLTERHKRLGAMFEDRYRITKDARDIDAAIVAYSKSIESGTKGSTEWLHSHLLLAKALEAQYQESSDTNSIEAAINVLEEVLPFLPANDTYTGQVYEKLGEVLLIWYDIDKEVAALEKAVKYIRKAQALPARNQNSRTNILFELSKGYYLLFEATGDIVQLENATSTLREIKHFTRMKQNQQRASLLVFANSLKHFEHTRNPKEVAQITSEYLNLIAIHEGDQRKKVVKDAYNLVTHSWQILQSSKHFELTDSFLEGVISAAKKVGEHKSTLVWSGLRMSSHIDRASNVTSFILAMQECLELVLLELSSDGTTKEEFASLFTNLLNFFYETRQPEAISISCRLLLIYSDTIAPPASAIEIYSDLGSHLWDLNNSIAIELLESSVLIARANNCHQELVSALTNLGAYYHDLLEDEENALSLTLEAIDVAEKHGFDNDTHAQFDAGNILLNMGRTAEAITYLKQAVLLGKQRGHFSDVVHGLRGLARQKKNSGLLPDAVEIYLEAVVIGRREQEHYALMWSLSELGNTFDLMMEYQLALQAYSDALELAKKQNETRKIRDLSRSVIRSSEALNKKLLVFQCFDSQSRKWVTHAQEATPELFAIIDKVQTTVFLWPTVQSQLKKYGQLQEKDIKASENPVDMSPTSEVQTLRNRIEKLLFRLIAESSPEQIDTLLGEMQKYFVEMETLVATSKKSNDEAVFSYCKTLCLIGKEFHGNPSQPHNELVGLEDDKQSAFAGEIALDKDLIVTAAYETLVYVANSAEEELGQALCEILTRAKPNAVATLIDKLSRRYELNYWSLQLVVFYCKYSKSISSHTLSFLTETLDIHATMGETVSFVQACQAVATKMVDLGKLEWAETYYMKAYKAATLLGDHELQATLCDYIGMMYRQWGKYEQALASYDKGIEIAQQAGKDFELTSNLHRKGNLLFDLMDYPTARANFEAALEVYMKYNDLSGMAYIFANFANIASRQGNKSKEYWYRRRAMDMATLSEDESVISLCAFHLGQTLRYRGEYSKAYQHLTLAEALYRKNGRPNRLLPVIRAIAEWHSDKQNPSHNQELAEHLYREALILARDLSSPLEIIDNLVGLTTLMLNKNQDEALVLLDEAINISESVPHYQQLVSNLSYKSLIMLNHDPLVALALLLRAIEITEMVMEQYVSRSDNIIFLSKSHAELINRAVAVAYISYQHELAGELMRRGKAFAAQVIYGSSFDQANSSVNATIPENLQLKAQEALEVLMAFVEEREFSAAENVTKNIAKYRVLRRNLDLTRRKMDEHYSQVKNLPTSYTNEEVAYLLSQLEIEPCLIEYTYCESMNLCVFTLITPDGSTELFGISLSMGQLKKCGDIVRTPGSKESENDTAESWYMPFKKVAEFVEIYIPSQRPIVLIPHGELCQIPLHALPCSEGCLFDRNPLYYLPSILELRPSVSSSEHSTFEDPLVIGSVFEEEAEQVAKVLGVRPILGKLIKKKTLLEQMGRQSIIHFSCHSVIDHKHPYLSGLLLADSEVLTCENISSIKLTTPLVVLSACWSASTPLNEASEIEGIAGAFLIAGARFVVSTLWEVDAEATRLLMALFYNALLTESSDAAIALRYAIKKLRRFKRWSHPYYWAGFIINGI